MADQVRDAIVQAIGRLVDDGATPVTRRDRPLNLNRLADEAGLEAGVVSGGYAPLVERFLLQAERSFPPTSKAQGVGGSCAESESI